MNEEWKSLGTHLVSNFGRVTKADGRPQPTSPTGKYAKHGRGYLAFKFQGKLTKVHILVAKAFVPNPDSKPEVNHDDGKTYNNAATNLKWVTSAEQQLHAIATGLKMQLKGERIGTAILTAAKVASIRRIYSSGGIGTRKLAKMFSISPTQIKRILRKESWAWL